MPLFHHARYVLTAARWDQLPADGQPEVAFVGRSNAGKSSAINALANHTQLAFVSKTPGRTQQINFFALRAGGFLVDLPGYGFAKVPRPLKETWEGFLGRYLMERAALAGLVVLMDARHPFTALDVQLLEWFALTGKPVHVLLTKADKLNQAERQRSIAQAKEAVWAGEGRLPEALSMQFFSATRKQGLDEAEEAVAPWLGQTVPQNKGP
ncbi:putative GTP-binding protein EngB [Burkholderiales bacterium]|nr:putative GTP-binding protein EngB [Burkholderiales bacterium]